MGDLPFIVIIDPSIPLLCAFMEFIVLGITEVLSAQYFLKLFYCADNIQHIGSTTRRIIDEHTRQINWP